MSARTCLCQCWSVSCTAAGVSFPVAVSSAAYFRCISASGCKVSVGLIAQCQNGGQEKEVGGVRRWEEEPSLSLWVAEWVGKRELQGLEPLLSP